MGCNSLLLNYDGSDPDMAYTKISKHHYIHIAADWLAGCLLAVKGTVIYKNYSRSYYYHAFGIAAIGIGFLFVAGI